MANSVIILLDELVTVNHPDQLNRYLNSMKSHLPTDSRLLLVVTQSALPALVLHHLAGVDWPGQWLSLYRKEAFYLVDPVLRAAPHVPIVWPDLMASIPPTRDENRFFHLCARYGLTRGFSWIEERGDYRVILSVAGVEAERDRAAQDLLECLMPRLADVAVRIVSARPNLSRLSKRECHILHCMTNGLPDHETAERVGLTTRTVRDKINKIKLLYGATNRCHLMSILFGLDFPAP
ncbi:autoinducer binding domain-containing protein [Pseudogulbenkiania ferrooxidans]|uniref:autoinducer binding domain-containing protein n=1 Tax=Pseudogulbenkiania ferrooxidans TaxID=549169 RepID=UPI00135F1A3D|nr:autoinducer binding domain-containing protein [Pseudogulbenkiania ferrooxidans]